MPEDDGYFSQSNFTNQELNMSGDVIAELSQVLEERKTSSAADSYVATLYAAGLNKILEKVGEEATEVLLASRDLAQGSPPGGANAPEPKSEKDPESDPATVQQQPGTRELTDALVREVADLWFHTMVMLTHQGIAPQQVLDELARRFGVSGIEEKRSR